MIARKEEKYKKNSNQDSKQITQIESTLDNRTFLKSEYPSAVVGMKLYHKNYGELTIKKVEKRMDKTIVYVVDSSEEISSKEWELLLKYNMIKILSAIYKSAVEGKEITL